MSKVLTKARIQDRDIRRISGRDIGLKLDPKEVYSFKVGDFCAAFKIKELEINHLIVSEYFLDPTLDEATLEGLEITEFHRGYQLSDGNTELYDKAFRRNGFFDFDNDFKDVVIAKLCQWDWSSNLLLANWYNAHKDLRKENSEIPIPVNFRYKRPTQRDQRTERPNKDTFRAENTQARAAREIQKEIVYPYVVFTPLDPQPDDQEFPKVEGFDDVINDLDKNGELDFDFRDIEEHQALEAWTLIYQLTGVTDSWRDAQLMKAHLYNAVFPRIQGERWIDFPSGFRQTLTIPNPPQIVPGEDDGLFEVTVEYNIQLPIVPQSPELTARVLEVLVRETPTDDITDEPVEISEDATPEEEEEIRDGFINIKVSDIEEGNS